MGVGMQWWIRVWTGWVRWHRELKEVAMGAIRDDVLAGHCMDSVGVGEVCIRGRPGIAATDDEWVVKGEWVEQVTEWSGEMHPMAGGPSLQQQWGGYVRTRLVFCFRWWLTRQMRQDPMRRGWVVWRETAWWWRLVMWEQGCGDRLYQWRSNMRWEIRVRGRVSQMRWARVSNMRWKMDRRHEVARLLWFIRWRNVVRRKY